jgi:3-oxoacyl-[acyl-carrier-protein] synthase III
VFRRQHAPVANHGREPADSDASEPCWNAGRAEQVEAAARRMKADPAQIISRIADFGNTSSASIPICLDELVRAGKLQRGEKVAICGFGAGLTYGAAIFSY